MPLEPFRTRWGPLATQYWGTAPPSTANDIGPFAVGDVVWNTAPTAGGVFGWVCVTPGPDGSTAVFKSFGAISP
jgi:hypothetical protein